jgi:hypothetical protein
LYNGEAKKQIDKIAYYQDNLAYFLYFFAFSVANFAKTVYLPKGQARFLRGETPFSLL